jgi:hypothetical protein
LKESSQRNSTRGSLGSVENLDQGQESEVTGSNSRCRWDVLGDAKYLLAVLAIIAGAIISAKTAELALDANGNTAKILIPKDEFTIEE